MIGKKVFTLDTRRRRHMWCVKGKMWKSSSNAIVSSRSYGKVTSLSPAACLCCRSPWSLLLLGGRQRRDICYCTPSASHPSLSAYYKHSCRISCYPETSCLSSAWDWMIYQILLYKAYPNSHFFPIIYQWHWFLRSLVFWGVNFFFYIIIHASQICNRFSEYEWMWDRHLETVT